MTTEGAPWWAGGDGGKQPWICQGLLEWFFYEMEQYESEERNLPHLQTKELNSEQKHGYKPFGRNLHNEPQTQAGLG